MIQADLIFYSYILKCFVLIDLKNHRLTHQDIEQMDMYIHMLDGLNKQSEDNPTIRTIFSAHFVEIGLL